MEEGELLEEAHAEDVGENGGTLVPDEEGEEYAEGNDDEDPYPSDAELQPRALPLGKLLDEDEIEDSEAPANSGEEYLRRVAREARRYPRVILASTAGLLVDDTAQGKSAHGLHMTESQRMPVLQAGMLAPEAWCTTTLQRFVSLRTKLSHAREGTTSLGNESAWRTRIRGPSAAPPSLTDLLALSPSAVSSLLQAQVRWLKRETSVTHTAGLWLFSTLTLLDTPLDADTSASLRALLRFTRSTLAAPHSSVPASAPEAVSMLPVSAIASLHVLALIAARYYSQQAPGE